MKHHHYTQDTENAYMKAAHRVLRICLPCPPKPYCASKLVSEPALTFQIKNRIMGS